jgi:hypothetical protein
MPVTTSSRIYTPQVGQSGATGVTYDDLPPIPIVATRPGATAPTLDTFVGTIEAYRFDATNDYVIGAQEFTHSYKEGTNIMAHVHWASNGTEGSAKYVRWGIKYCISNSSTGVTGSEQTLEMSSDATIPANTPDRTFYISSLGTISGTGITIGSYITYKFYRVAASGTAPAADPFALAVGFHVQQDTFGSLSATSKT